MSKKEQIKLNSYGGSKVKKKAEKGVHRGNVSADLSMIRKAPAGNMRATTRRGFGHDTISFAISFFSDALRLIFSHTSKM